MLMERQPAGHKQSGSSAASDVYERQTVQLSHFLKTSPSLRHLAVRGAEEHPKEDELKDTFMKTSIVFESISRSSLLFKLKLSHVLFGDECPLEDFLSSTRTLLEFSHIISVTLTYQT